MANVNKPIAKSEERIRTPKGIIIYPWLFSKDKVQDRYAMILAVDPEDPALDEFKKACKTFGKDAFKDNAPDNLSWCILSGDKWLAGKEKAPTGKLRAAVEGKVLIKMHSNFAPTVSVAKGGKLQVVENEQDQKLVYTGAIGAAQGVFAAFDGKYPAVVFWFSQVARLAAGEKLGGGDPNKVFGDMYDEDDDSVGAGNASGDLDDDISF